jgi:acyl carrier protein
MGLDSVELVLEIEEAFGCRISDAQAEKMRTPGHIIDWLMTEQASGRLFSTPPLAPRGDGLFAKLLPPLAAGSVRLETRVYSRDEIRDVVFKIVAEQLGVSRVWEDADFVRDLGLD